MKLNRIDRIAQEGVGVFITLDHDAATRMVIGVGNDLNVTWMTLDDVKWLQGRLTEAIAAVNFPRETERSCLRQAESGLEVENHALLKRLVLALERLDISVQPMIEKEKNR